MFIVTEYAALSKFYANLKKIPFSRFMWPLILLRPMKLSIKFDTAKSGRFIVYIEGPQLKIALKYYISLKIDFVSANIAAPGEMPQPGSSLFTKVGLIGLQVQLLVHANKRIKTIKNIQMKSITSLVCLRPCRSQCSLMTSLVPLGQSRFCHCILEASSFLVRTCRDLLYVSDYDRS